MALAPEDRSILIHMRRTRVVGYATRVRLVDREETMEEYTTGSGQVLTVHDAGSCLGTWCVIHRPQPGPMASWPTHWRGDGAFDIVSLMERTCPHGVGHPAPEQFEHWEMADEMWKTTHGCDGCCVKTRQGGNDDR